MNDRFDRLKQSLAIFSTNRDAILYHLHSCAEPFDFWIDINSHQLLIHPNAQVTLLLEKLEELPRLGVRRNSDPKRDKDVFASTDTHYLIRDCLSCYRWTFA